MNSMKNKSNGAKNKTVGIIKEKVGKAVGNPKLETQGTSEHMRGQIQSVINSLQKAAKYGLKQVDDSIKRAKRDGRYPYL